MSPEIPAQTPVAEFKQVLEVPEVPAVPDVPEISNVAELEAEIEEPEENQKECPCGGGQSCIVTRRLIGGFNHEDIVLEGAGVNLREHCLSEPTDAQDRAMREWFELHNSPNSLILLS